MGQVLERKWVLAEKITQEIDREFLIFPSPMREILFNRGFTNLEEAEAYLRADTPIHSPWLLLGLEKSIERLVQAIQQKERIAIYGDYDVDGVTATVLLVEVIQQLGGEVQKYIPNRFDEGYGLNCDALESLFNEDVKVVVTVDCGIRSPREADFARQLGMDLIVSDHHHPRGEPPPAFAVICPRQPEDLYPNKEISGVGLAYKIAQALIERFPNPDIQIENWLDLVALGTVADVVPLVGENRVLVRKGLEVIHTGNRKGIVALANISGVNFREINSTDIGFKLGPRLNASGRLESALESFDLLITDSLQVAAEKATALESYNQERQKITLKSQRIAEEIARKSERELIYFAASEEFNEGIVGLIASKMTEAHYRPSIAGRTGEESTRASCRSIPEFHITNALDECADLLVRHGGHAMAAGFTVKNENMEILLERLFAIAERDLGNLDLNPRVNIDCEVPLSEMKMELLPILDQLNPTGAGNPGAVFLTRQLEVTEIRKIGSEGKHLRMRVKQGGQPINVVAFGMGEWAERSPKMVDLVYRFELNEFNGYRSPQLNVIDLRESSN
jgi:single-stranded-DNA-specific exonuclease